MLITSYFLGEIYSWWVNWDFRRLPDLVMVSQQVLGPGAGLLNWLVTGNWVEQAEGLADAPQRSLQHVNYIVSESVDKVQRIKSGFPQDVNGMILRLTMRHNVQRCPYEGARVVILTGVCTGERLGQTEKKDIWRHRKDKGQHRSNRTQR